MWKISTVYVKLWVTIQLRSIIFLRIPQSINLEILPETKIGYMYPSPLEYVFWLKIPRCPRDCFQKFTFPDGSGGGPSSGDGGGGVGPQEAAWSPDSEEAAEQGRRTHPGPPFF